MRSRLPRAMPRATSHLTLRAACGEARLDFWMGGPTGVMVQIVWRSADTAGGFVRASAPAPLRIRTVAPDGSFIPGSAHSIVRLARGSAWVRRCVPTGVCETLVADDGGPLVSVVAD